MGDDASGADSDPQRPSDSRLVNRKDAIRLAGRAIFSGIGALLSLKSSILSPLASAPAKTAASRGRLDQPGSGSPLFAPAVLRPTLAAEDVSL